MASHILWIFSKKKKKNRDKKKRVGEIFGEQNFFCHMSLKWTFNMIFSSIFLTFYLQYLLLECLVMTVTNVNHVYLLIVVPPRCSGTRERGLSRHVWKTREHNEGLIFFSSVISKIYSMKDKYFALTSYLKYKIGEGRVNI